VRANFVKRGGEHDFGFRVPDPGELDLEVVSFRIFLSRGPVGGHDLVELATVQEGAQLARLVVREAVDLLVDDAQSSSGSAGAMYPSSDTIIS